VRAEGSLGGAESRPPQPSRRARSRRRRPDSLSELTKAVVDAEQAEPEGFRIFISYRRDDDASAAGRLYDLLEGWFKPEQIFMDIDSIEPGVEFRQELARAVGACDVFIAVIGKKWLTLKRDGIRRVDHATDWVRIEIETALKRDIRLIPVLVNGASLPIPEALPESIRGLAWRQSFDLPHGDFKGQASKLAAILTRLQEAKAARLEEARSQRLAHEAAQRADRARALREAAEEQERLLAAERERIAREAAEQEERRRAAVEAEKKERQRREREERVRIAERMAVLEGKTWAGSSRTEKQRYLRLIEVIAKSNPSPSELAERDGKSWIRLDAIERLHYTAFVDVARGRDDG
jgi:hypothetical protein